MERKILSQLYDDAVLHGRICKDLIDDVVYDELNKEFQMLYDKLLGEVSEEQKKLMDLIYEAHLRKSNYEEEVAFKYGVALGIRMATEAFVITQNTTEDE